MKKSAGLVIMTKIPKENGGKVLVAILQRRGTFNHEKMTSESYPGCCQVTAHGGLKDTDEGMFNMTITRKCAEELGRDFARICMRKTELIVLVEVKTEEKEVVTFGIIIPANDLRIVQLGPDTGGLVYITAEEVGDIVPITNGMKMIGPEFTHTLAMFPDEIEAVRKAFEVFEKE